VNANFFTCKDTKTFLGRKVPYFVGNWARLTGISVSDGRVVSRDGGGVWSMLVARDGSLRFGYFFPKIPADAQQIISGSELVVKDGKAVATANDLAPRTIVGVDRQGKRLVMLVIDGRRDDYSVGMTSVEAAKEMIALGCYNALNLDGGGSSTMVMRDEGSDEVRLLNRPSDGHDLPISLSLERPVACAFGVEIAGEQK